MTGLVDWDAIWAERHRVLMLPAQSLGPGCPRCTRLAAALAELLPLAESLAESGDCRVDVEPALNRARASLEPSP